ncbi:MAG: hypothetical protein WAU34_13660, partial [Desulfobacterales bacterium]
LYVVCLFEQIIKVSYHDQQPTSQICLDHHSDSKEACIEEHKTKLAYGSIHFFRHKKGLRFLSKPLILQLTIPPGFKPGVPAL